MQNFRIFPEVSLDSRVQGRGAKGDGMEGMEKLPLPNFNSGYALGSAESRLHTYTGSV